MPEFRKTLLARIAAIISDTRGRAVHAYYRAKKAIECAERLETPEDLARLKFVGRRIAERLLGAAAPRVCVPQRSVRTEKKRDVSHAILVGALGATSRRDIVRAARRQTGDAVDACLGRTLARLARQRLLTHAGDEVVLTARGALVAQTLHTPAAAVASPLFLAVDMRENKSRREVLFFQEELQEREIRVVTRQLPLGDFCWLRRETAASGRTEYVQPCIVERKSGADLLQSMNDGRFSEQLCRLCELGFDAVFYIVEDAVCAPQALRRLRTAVAALCRRCTVVETACARETVEVLAQITQRLSRTRARELCWTDFARLGAKSTHTQAGVFARQLHGMCGLSAGAAALCAHYVSLRDLRAALERRGLRARCVDSSIFAKLLFYGIFCRSAEKRE